MCGIIGIFSDKPVAGELYEGMIHLQHRGTDAAGMVTYDKRFHIKKGLGLVRDVYSESIIQKRMTGNIGIGHNRYTTAGSAKKIYNVQPFLSFYSYGLALVHNGNLVNSEELKKEMLQNKKYFCNSESDTELILALLISFLQENKKDDFFEKMCEAVNYVFDKAVGGYSIIGIIPGQGMFAFRDPNGIRPLVYGSRKNSSGKEDFIFSSENTMYHALGFKMLGNVLAGELVFIDIKGFLKRRKIRNEIFTPCAFEYIYLARPDAVINNVSVYKARLRMGENLAKKWKKIYPDLMPDIVVPVPFCANTMAISIANELRVRYSEGLYKNAFVGRTFIMPGQKKRRQSVLQKLSPQTLELKNKTVMLVDDSIVRGTTSKEVVKLVRDAGAKTVYFVSAAPPIKNPDFYGIDIATHEELIAANKSVEEIRKYIEADVLMYQDIHDLVEAITRKGDHKIDRLSMPYFDGWYVTDKYTKNKKKILLIGSGAREHAIAKAFVRSEQKPELFCFSSSINPGIKELCKVYEIGKITDTDSILNFAKQEKIDFVIIGPEAPLEVGLSDLLWLNGFPCVGPKQKLARIETSKIFARDLMKKYIPFAIPKYKNFSSIEGALEFLIELGGNFVIKADGLMGGKGVKVSGDHLQDNTEALNYCQEILNGGNNFVIEEKLIGQEFSLMSFTDGKTLSHMPPVQDHKRLLDGDIGPNTGGMGSYSCEDHLLPFLKKEDIEFAQKINEQIIEALYIECGDYYKGILYGGFMLTKTGVKVIEYNARFGDPEAINVLTLLESDLVLICEEIVSGKLNPKNIIFAKKAVVCKYLVPFGYPDDSIRGEKIEIDEATKKENLFFSAIEEQSGSLIETGSRAVAVAVSADTVYEAEEKVEREILKIKGPLYHRKDIGTKELIEKRVQMMYKIKL